MFKNFKIGFRMAMTYVFILAFMIVIIIISLNQIKISADMFNRVVNINNERLQLAYKMIDDTREVSISIRNILLMQNKETTSDMKNRIEEIRKQYDANFAALEQLITEDDTMSFSLAISVKTLQLIASSLNNNILELAVQNKYTDAINLMNQKAAQASQEWIDEIDNLITHTENRSNMRYQEAAKIHSSARITVIAIGSFAILIAVLISVMMTFSITRPLKTSLEAANLISGKDLTKDLSGFCSRKDEFGFLLSSFNRMTEMLRDQMKSIQNGVNVLSSSSAEIMASTAQIASGSSETAAAITETTTTVEEVRQAAQLSSQKSKNLTESTNRVAQVSRDGQKSVNETADRIKNIRIQMDNIAETVIRLSEQSQSIGGIIATVTDLADQSNLLAVNAAIEAAKAGEYGKGFSVVAQEIKNLAEQSKQSTLQIRNILNDIQKSTSSAVLVTEQGNKAVEEGSKKSEEAGEAIRILTGNIEETAQVAVQISASSQQQLVGMDQIGAAMQNINQASTENAASMAQAEESVKNLHDIGQKLKDIVEEFKL